MGERETVLVCEDLHVRRNQRTVLNGFDLQLAAGEVAVLHVHGRETPTRLAEVLSGATRLQVDSGAMRVDGIDVAELDLQQRSQRGLLLVDPLRAVAGVTVTNHVRIALQEHDQDLGTQEMRKRLLAALEALELDSHFAGRTLPEEPLFPDGLRLVLLTLAVVQPPVAILPVGDGEVDLDAVRLLATGLERIEHAPTALVVLTSDARLVQELPADQKWDFAEGRIAGPFAAAQG